MGFYTNNRLQNVDVINKNGLFITLQNSRKPKAVEIAAKLGLNIIIPFKEQQTINTIINAISGIIRYELQYKINNFFVDMYLPDLKIVIECDEFNHCKNNKQKEVQRQIYIEEQLDCTFIRYNPDSSDFNIGNIINKIFLMYLSKD